MNVVLWSLLIFISRVFNVALGTIRIQMIANRKKYLAAIIGFFEALIFIIVIGKVLQDISHILNIIAYCGGFSAGSILGISLEEKINKRIIQATIISRGSSQLVKKIRNYNFGATSISGQGNEGNTDLINVMLREDRQKELEQIVNEVDDSAFVVFYPLSQVRGGYFRKIR